MRLRRVPALLAGVVLSAALVAPAGAAAGPRGGSTYVPERVRSGKLPSFDGYRASGTTRTVAAQATKVGARKLWPALDDTHSDEPTAGIYFKRFKLRARSEHAEIWTAADSDGVSTGLAFPAGDCRNDRPELVKISDARIKYFLRQFERRMYPRESRWFSVPPARSGDPRKAQLRSVLKPAFGLKVPGDYWAGSGKRVVILVDNVRDENFYDTDNSESLPRIGGFFWNVFSELTDRHIMSIDSFDWLHRTGAEPPHEPSTDPCNNYPSNPFSFEATFAHEYQHLLMNYADPNGETPWLNEGISDWAQTLTGYADPSAGIDSVYGDAHILGFLGYLEQASEFNLIPAEHAGPENSLTWWEDQQDAPDEIFAEYGAAYSFMEVIADRYGRDAMRFLHNADSDGLDSVGGMLRNQSAGIAAAELVHDWLLAMAVDKVLDAGAVAHGLAGDFEVGTMNAMVDWNNDDAYMTPGAPPNGGDFVLARRGNGGQQLSAADIDTISFDGADALPPAPVEWTVVTDAPGRAAGDQALYSGQGANLDRSIVEEVTVPAAGATLSFDTVYQTEEFYDYGFVQVSTDGGETWTSLANDHTSGRRRTETGPPISDNLPGLTGTSGGGTDPAWVTETFNLSAYAGRTILLSFRYMSDPGVNLPGWWIDNVRVGSTIISDGSDVAEWQTMTEVNPFEVAGFTVQLVAWTNDLQEVWAARLPLGAGHQGSLSGAALDAAIGTTADNVGVIVTYDEPTESVLSYASYALSVNQFEQPGGN